MLTGVAAQAGLLYHQAIGTSSLPERQISQVLAGIRAGSCWFPRGLDKPDFADQDTSRQLAAEGFLPEVRVDSRHEPSAHHRMPQIASPRSPQ